MPLPRLASAALAAALLTLAGACSAEGQGQEQEGQRRTHQQASDPAPNSAPNSAPNPASGALPELGLLGTIPLYWGESDSFGGLLSGQGDEHWARARLETGYRIRPLDVLDTEALAALEFLLLAQPRAPSAAENVALDAWVRGGGRLLLFADPMLTGESRFPLGDRRRPQDTILLSPILSHWGLELQFDIDQAPGIALLGGTEAAIPVNLPGRFALRGEAKACELGAAGVLVRCTIGAGYVVALADAAVLDLHHAHPAAPAALDWLASEAFAERGK